MKLKIFIPIIVPALLFGCADSGTQGDITERNYEDLVNIRDSQNTTINVYLHGASDTDTNTKQDTKNSATVSPETSASLARAGATATSALGETVEAVVEGITNTFTPDNSTTTENSVPVLKPEKKKVSVDNDGVSEFEPLVYELRQEGNKSFTWMKVPNFVDHSGPMTFTFDGGCGVLKVPDVKHTWGEDGNSKNHAQRFYFSGNPKEQKDFNDKGNPVGNPYGSVFTAPGCAATTVTVTRG